MPKFNGHYPDIPEGNVALTNRELERLRKKYGDAMLEADEDAAGVLEEPAADPAVTAAGNTAADGDPVPDESAGPGAAAQDPLPELEPEPVQEEDPDPADDTPADYSGFFAGADELLEDLAPDAAAEAFARYIGGLSFDTHRGEMTAETQWPGPVPAVVSEPSYTVIQPLPAAGKPDNDGAENKRPARAKKPSFFSGRKARGAGPRSSHPAGDTQMQNGGLGPPPAEDPDNTGLAAAVDIDEPSGLIQPLPAQIEPEVSVETVTDTDELDFTRKYLGYAAPAAPGGDVPAADKQDQSVDADTPAAPAIVPDETFVEVPVPAEESISETVVTDEDVSVPMLAQEAPETPAVDSVQKPLSFWEKRKQRKALKAESNILTVQPPAEPEAVEPSPDSPAEQDALVDTAAETYASPEAGESVLLPEPSASPEEIYPQTQAQSDEEAKHPAEAAKPDESAVQVLLPADENIVETVISDEDVSIPAPAQAEPETSETPAVDSVKKPLSFWEKRRQRKALKAEQKNIPASPAAEAEASGPFPDSPAEESAKVDPATESLPEADESVPLPEPPAPPEEIAPQRQESVSEMTDLPVQTATPAAPEEISAQKPEPAGEAAELPVQTVSSAPPEETVPDADAQSCKEDNPPEQADEPVKDETADNAAPGTEAESPMPEPHGETAAAQQETLAETGKEDTASVPEDTEESDIADTVSGEALEAEKPPATPVKPQVPDPQPQNPPNAGMRIIYRAPEAAALDAGGQTAEPAGEQNNGKINPAGQSSYQKYIRFIYQAPGAFHEESETAPPAQAEPAEDTAPQTAEPGEPKVSPPPSGEEGAAAPADTAQESAAEETNEENAQQKSLDEVGTEAGASGTREPGGEQTAGEPGAEQTPGAGILEELSAEKKHSRFKRFLRAFFPQKADSAAEKIRKSVLVLATLTIFVCGGILLNSYVIEPAMSNRQIAKAIELKKNSSLDKNWPDIQSKYAGVDFPPGMLPRYAGLYVANRDFSGWLTIDALGIDMPLVQGETNGDYLRTDFYGKPSRYGCCFFDYRNNIQTLDRNTIVYGHNMGSSDLLMFGNLEKYSRIDGFKTAPVIECNTIYALMKWKVYAVFVTNALPSQDNGYLFNYIFPEMENDDDFAGYIAQLDRRKLYTTGVDLLKSDKILTLSTCSYAFDDARLVVVARLVRPGESEKVDTSLAAVNPSPKYPQIWYTKNGQTNPYQNDEKWYP